MNDIKKLILQKENRKLEFKEIKQEIMKILDKADGTIKQHLSNLKKEDKIKRIGSTKSGYWKVI